MAESVFDRNLVSENPSAKDILNNHQAYSSDTSKRSAEGMVLGYVTPVSIRRVRVSE